MDDMIHKLMVPQAPVWWTYDATLALALITMIVLARLMIHELRR